MKKLITDREKLQNKVRKLGELGKLNRPTSEVISYPNWMLREVIKLRALS